MDEEPKPETGISLQQAGKPWLFKPGQSGNPSGRPKSPRGYILNRTNGGRDVSDLLLRIMRGEEPGFRGSDRMEALKMVITYIWGKPENGPEAIKAELLTIFTQVRDKIQPEVFAALLDALDTK